MDFEILKKKISTYRGEGGRISITDDGLLIEILEAWERWTGPASGFYTSLGISSKGISSIIGRAKKLKREGFPSGDFKEIKIDGAGPLPGPSGNVEYFLWLVPGAVTDAMDDDVVALVAHAVATGPTGEATGWTSGGDR